MNKSLFFVLVAATMLFVGCSKSTPSSDNQKYQWKTITKQDAFNFLYFTNGVQGAFVPKSPIEMTSDPYCVPSIRWVENVYGPELKKFLFNNNVMVYRLPENDCVRFSSYGLACANILHATGKGGPKGTSLAVGTVDYVVNFYLWHSINVFIVTNDKGELELYYSEPQNQTRVPNKDVDSEWWGVRM